MRAGTSQVADQTWQGPRSVLAHCPKSPRLPLYAVGLEPAPSWQLGKGVCPNTAKVAKEKRGCLGYCNKAFKKSVKD